MSATPLVIVGAGGFGREVRVLLRDVNRALPTFDFLGYLDDGEVEDGLLERLDARVIGGSVNLATIDASYVIAIAEPEPRRRIAALGQTSGRTAATLIHPSAMVGSDIRLAAGVIIAACVHLTTNISIGRHSMVNIGGTIGHDCVIGDYVTIHGSVHVSGRVVIEDGVTIGSGAVIVPGIRIGAGSVVGAGAVVAKDVAPGVTVVGPVARQTLGVGSGKD